MPKKETKSIQFSLDIEPEEDEEVVLTNGKAKQSKHLLFKRPVSNGHATQEAKIKPPEINEKKQKAKLVKYLSSEKQIVKKKVEIDHDERILLDSLGNTVIDLDKYLKFPEAKVKDKLWRIPYYFRNDTELDNDDDDALKSINRFGQGISDGCFVSLSLPTKRAKVDKNWEDIMEQADEVLDQFEQAKWSRLTRQRRGSTLQPRHVFLNPNPELGNSEKLLLIGHSLSLRDWTSELFLGTNESNSLLDVSYKQNICLNTSLDDLSNMLFPDLKSNALTSSEIQYIQTVRNRRRQSLVPPSFEGQSDMKFRRQSFAGGELWSAKVEKDRKREIYHQKVKMINPNFVYVPKQMSPLEIAMEANRAGKCHACDPGDLRTNHSLAMYSDYDPDYYPEFDFESTEEATLFAHELTLIVRQHFIAIKESEIINFITRSGPHVLNSCANIKGFFHLQNRIIRLIATYIVHHDELNQRVGAILFFIQVIRILHQLGNWHSINVITQSLQCPPIVRLKETWRKITFNYADEYCYFIQISEDLASGKQLTYYDTLKTFIGIFDDVVDKIKERCGFKIVQIHQHRLDKNWDKSGKEGDIMTWVNSEILDLLKDINGNLEDKFVETNSLGKKPSIASIAPHEVPTKKVGFFHRFFLCPLSNATKKPSKKSKKSIIEEELIIFPPPIETEEVEEAEEYDPSAIYQRRLLSGQIITRQTNLNSKVPTTKKFWSISEFNKLRDKDKEQVKQEIVRTLVAFQKKTFCVFEERDEQIKNFLLNSQCDSMDTCMLKSRAIEGDTKKDYGHKKDNHPDKEHSPVNGIIAKRTEHEVDDNAGADQVTETRHRTRRVMFAQDLDDSE